jgi:formylglycine-generating enzyme required for sulfatase activity
MHTLEEIYQKLAAMDQRLRDYGVVETSGDMVLIPAGSFVMGDTFGEGQSDELPLHTNTISAFYIEKYEVSGNLWGAVYTWATNHGYAFMRVGLAKAATHPVQTVQWYDCVAWCNARSQRDGFTPCYTNTNGTFYTNSTVAFAGGCNWNANGYRLPTEAEWEKAARGGLAGMRFPWKDANTIQHARANYYADPASYPYDTSPTTGYHPDFFVPDLPYSSPVGSLTFSANGYGLRDMAGNVGEWCWDWYLDTYYSSSPATDPRGPATGTSRVVRGDTWAGPAYGARCAARFYSAPDLQNDQVGLRCARAVQ